MTKEELLLFRRDVARVTAKEDLLEYIRRIGAESRDTLYVQLGASPRALVAALKAAKAVAALRGANFLTPDEIKDVIVPVLRHRIILRPEALIDGLTPDYFLENILQRIPVPR
jgi:MoxR-like ATPase